MDEMGDEQKTLENFDQADKLDDDNSPYFSPLTNIKYDLTFKALANGRPFEIRILNGTDYNDKTKIVPTPVLVVRIESINGAPADKEWSIWNKKGREAFRGACETGSILKKKFSFKVTEDKKAKIFSLSEVGDK